MAMGIGRGRLCRARRLLLLTCLALPAAATALGAPAAGHTAASTTAAPTVAADIAADVQAYNQQYSESDEGRYKDGQAVDVRSVLAALALLSGSFFVVLLGLRLYLHCIRRRPERKERRAKMKQEDVENRFPVVRWVGNSGEDTCVICLSNIEEGDECRVTQCGHSFHADCLLSWWMYKPRRNLRCPMCRTRQRRRERKHRQGAGEELEVEASPNSEEAGDEERGLGLCEAFSPDRPVKLPCCDALQPSMGDRACSMRSEDYQIAVVMEEPAEDPECGLCTNCQDRGLRCGNNDAGQAELKPDSIVVLDGQEFIEV